MDILEACRDASRAYTKFAFFKNKKSASTSEGHAISDCCIRFIIEPDAREPINDQVIFLLCRKLLLGLGKMQHNFAYELWSLSKWMAFKTSDARSLIVQCINFYQPAKSSVGCQRLVQAHLRFHRLVSPVYRDTNLASIFMPFFAERKTGYYNTDMSNCAAPDAEIISTIRLAPKGLLPRMGWLYAAEFVNCGLTKLLDCALADHLEYKTDLKDARRSWESFRRDLDLLNLSDRDEESLARSAHAALIIYSNLFQDAYIDDKL